LGKAFGTAGVRGVFNQTQTPEQVYQLAETIAFTFGKGRYGVGWDGRKTSALLAKTVMSAVNTMGSEVLSFGPTPTPVIAFATRSRSCLAGFSVTASHNPAEFSGVKVFSAQGMELSKQSEDRIERALAIDVMKPSGNFGIFSEDDQALDDYIDALTSRFDRGPTPLSIAIDCANGPGALVTPEVLKALGHRVISVNAHVSWRFPARPPEPTSANLADFARMVPGLGVDYAFAHDGDADRLVMVSRNGNVIPDSIVAILALRGLNSSGGTVVISENCSTAVQEEAERLGHSVLRSRIGKTFAVLESERGVFACEPSKIVDPRWGLWEDGINAAAIITSLLSREPDLLNRIIGENPWHYRQINFNLSMKMPLLIGKAKDAFRKYRVIQERSLDGYKMIFQDNSWIMFRPSGTEPKVRLYCESKDPQMLEVMVQLGTQCVESSL
jgi:phosphomannomutase